MKIFPNTFMFLFSETFPYYIFSEWIEVVSTKSGSLTWYNDATRVFKNNEFINYFELIDYASEEQ